MKAFFFWETVGGLTLKHRCNPYAGLLALELAKHDIHLELGDYTFERDWLAENRPAYDILHLNWLQKFYDTGGGEPLERAVERYTQFAENMALLCIWLYLLKCS